MPASAQPLAYTLAIALAGLAVTASLYSTGAQSTSHPDPPPILPLLVKVEAVSEEKNELLVYARNLGPKHIDLQSIEGHWVVLDCGSKVFEGALIDMHDSGGDGVWSSGELAVLHLRKEEAHGKGLLVLKAFCTLK